MDFKKLAHIQSLDKRLMELDALRGDLPEKVEILKQQLSELENNMTHHNENLIEAKKTILSNKNDHEQLNSKIAKYQEQIYSVKTNKEYDAITTEIELIENKLNENELNGVELLEKEEQLIGQIEALGKKIAELKDKLSANETELNQKLEQTRSEEQQLQQQRELISKSLDRRLYYQYERIRKGKNGIALSEVFNYTCSGCYATIPAQTVVELRKQNQFILCESCGRILIAPKANKTSTVEIH